MAVIWTYVSAGIKLRTTPLTVYLEEWTLQSEETDSSTPLEPDHPPDTPFFFTTREVY